MKPMLRRNYVGKESNCSGGKEKERQGRERSRAVESARKRLACVSFFLFILSVFHYLKKKKSGWASPGRCPGKPGGRIASVRSGWQETEVTTLISVLCKREQYFTILQKITTKIEIPLKEKNNENRDAKVESKT
jgi:hypothetical protein